FDIQGYGPMGVATVSCALLLAIALLWGLFSYYQSYLLASAGQRLTYTVRRRFFAHLQRLSLSVHAAHRTGDLVLRATGDTNMLREMLVESALIILSEFLVVFAMLGVMFWMDWQLTTVSLAVLPLMTLTAFRFSPELRGGDVKAAPTRGAAPGSPVEGDGVRGARRRHPGRRGAGQGA